MAKFLIFLLVVLVVVIVIYLKKKKAAGGECDDQEYIAFREAEQEALESVLGEMGGMVGHSMIPFYLGGGVHMYPFPNCIKGTGFATMELLGPDSDVPVPNDSGTYELIMFTRLSSPDLGGMEQNQAFQASNDNENPFKITQDTFSYIMGCIARYCSEAKLCAKETCELPAIEDQPGEYLIFDEYTSDDKPFIVDGEKHGLLLCIRLFRSEMEYSMENGGDKLLRMLKDAGDYPYSDLDRKPVC